jgi:hypothetical protein
MMGTFSLKFTPVEASGDLIEVTIYNKTSTTSAGHGNF